MGRSESKQVVNQGTTQSAQDQQNAQMALGKIGEGVAGYQGALGNFMRFGRRAYGENGELARTNNAIATTQAAAGSKAISGDLALDSMRTGANTANFAPAEAEARRQGSRDMTATLATQNADRLSKLAGLEQYGVEAEKFPAEAYGPVFGASTSGAGTQLDAAGSAAKTPGFWDTFLPALAQGAGTAVAGACPCEGALVKMADGSEQPVETLEAGDFLQAMSEFSPPVPVLSAPQRVMAKSFVMRTAAGRVHKGSDTHTLALAIGGYGYLPEIAGATVIAERGTDLVEAVEAIGEQAVFVMNIGGNHMYLVDGIWAMA